MLQTSVHRAATMTSIILVHNGTRKGVSATPSQTLVSCGRCCIVIEKLMKTYSVRYTFPE